MKPNFAKLFIPVFFLTLSIQISYVAASNVADFLNDKGREAYTKGDTATAIHEFSKVLLVDPNNAMAKEYLEKLGLRRGVYGLSPSPASPKQPAMMQKELEDYQVRIQALEKTNSENLAAAQQLEAEKANLSKTLEAKNDDLARLTLRIEDLQKNLNKNTSIDKTMIEALEQTLHKHKDEVELLKRTLHQQKNILKSQEEILSKKERELRHYKDRTLEIAYVPPPVEPAPPMEAGLSPEKIALMKRKDFTIAELKERLVGTKKQINTLEKSLKNAGYEDMVVLQKSLDDAKERLSLVEVIVQEKQQQIYDLEDQLAKTREQCSQ